jgi:hypothetical protein
VIVVCPSFVTHVDSPVARSAVSALKTAASMSVVAWTGWPVEFIWNAPLPLNDTGKSFNFVLQSAHETKIQL